MQLFEIRIFVSVSDEKGVVEHLASLALSIYAAALSTLRQDHNFHPLNQRRINLQDIQIRRGSAASSQ